MSTEGEGLDEQQQALLAALRAVLEPLSRLAVARGVPYALLEEVLRLSVVRAAAQAHPGLAPHRSVSRIATATGLNRREVTRLVEASSQAKPPTARSLINEVYARWRTSAEYTDEQGAPKALKRLGPAPSFESLAQSVTRDVHPRSMLDELLRLKMARLDETTDLVTVPSDGFVPSGDRIRMLGFLADNVGDHLSAGVDNVLDEGRRHFEQAVFADGLSQESVEAVRAMLIPQWTQLLKTLVPPLEAHVQRDAQVPLAQQKRIRVGLYAYDAPSLDALAEQAKQPTPKPVAPLRRPRKS
jgi:Family of unknown function (DUF6502)